MPRTPHWKNFLDPRIVTASYIEASTFVNYMYLYCNNCVHENRTISLVFDYIN